ncbi:hypothetical protein [Ignavibacterium sp.]|uniref:hypothetical protein n=1 Tax=Ignavibacterium sp. TaxID=2651167 RepID=UPI002209A23B|nr:hypothetical protein [Ignavibacterium sp.]BDQ03642.1 MAG: hypothetical protein KatS3mg037_2217 [Ignavibacterium sp.]
MEKEIVEKFLRDLKTKIKIYDIIFRNDRNKNLQTLAALEITPIERKKYIEKLSVDNYCSGPNRNTLYPEHADYWEFGMKIKSQEVYIKIEMGLPNSSVICISFHIAEHKLKYKFKRGK